jgi:hypothetical protein
MFLFLKTPKRSNKMKKVLVLIFTICLVSAVLVMPGCKAKETSPAASSTPCSVNTTLPKNVERLFKSYICPGYTGSSVHSLGTTMPIPLGAAITVDDFEQDSSSLLANNLGGYWNITSTSGTSMIGMHMFADIDAIQGSYSLCVTFTPVESNSMPISGLAEPGYKWGYEGFNTNFTAVDVSSMNYFKFALKVDFAVIAGNVMPSQLNFVNVVLTDVSGRAVSAAIDYGKEGGRYFSIPMGNFAPAAAGYTAADILPHVTYLAIEVYYIDETSAAQYLYVSPKIDNIFFDTI